VQSKHRALRAAAALTLGAACAAGAPAQAAITAANVTYFVTAGISDDEPQTPSPQTLIAHDVATFLDKKALVSSPASPAVAQATQTSFFDAFPNFSRLEATGTAQASAGDTPFLDPRAEAESKVEVSMVTDALTTVQLIGTVSKFSMSGESFLDGSTGILWQQWSAYQSGTDAVLGVVDVTLVLQPGVYSFAASARATAYRGPVPDPTGTFTVTMLVSEHPCADPAAIVGSSFDDPNLNGTQGDDIICGFQGDDVIRGFGGSDRIYGGPAYFTPQLGAGASGDDTVFAGGGNDRVFGDDGKDVLLGGTGNDRLRGGGGPDDLDGGTGKDRLFGEGGKDLLRARDGKRDPVVDGGDSADKAEVDASDTVTAVETLLP